METNNKEIKRRSTFSLLFYINRTKVRKDGTCKLLCKVSIDAKSAPININAFVDPSLWNPETKRANGRSENARTVNLAIEKLTEKFKAKSQKTVNFITDIKAETAYADAEYLEEVLSNLIDNSIKYSGESVEIRISIARDDRYTVLKVHDNGFGISDKDIHLIFRKYERASAVKRNRRNGTSGFGLGLNFVDQVVEAHHGKIFVSSIEGEFTEFTIYLPLIES